MNTYDPAAFDRAADLRGSLDCVTRGRIAGWAQDPRNPDMPVSLLITADEQLIARVLADQLRSDLEAAGVGNGRHSFNLAMAGALAVGRHVIAVRRESDGMHLQGSPVLLDADGRFDALLQEQFAAVLSNAASDADWNERLAFLARQTEMLLRQRADRHTRRIERFAPRHSAARWSCLAGAVAAASRMEPVALPLRALFIDETVPALRRDAGSNAVLSHMQSMQRLGFEVSFAAADMSTDCAGMLNTEGVRHCHVPWYGSVEEVLRREADSFDVVYLHRISVATRYLGLIRRHQRKARLVYSVADLHHLRLARQAEAERRPELLALSRRIQASELLAAAESDAVITHSTYEAALLHEMLPGARVHVVPWAVTPRPTPVPFKDRNGVAFIGHYHHAPNMDAAQWLMAEIMPLVSAHDSAIQCLLVGSGMPDELRRALPGIQPIGQVDNLEDVFNHVRVTIAPLAYGAGVKGKVLESLAAGVPCVCTPIAAEGLDLPPLLRELVATDAAGLAALVRRLHADEVMNTACREAGLNYVSAMLSQARVDGLLRNVALLPGSYPAISEAELIGLGMA